MTFPFFQDNLGKLAPER